MATNATDHRNRQIVGISLDPKMAKAFKEEAAKRGSSCRSLFETMWALYLKQPKGGK